MNADFPPPLEARFPTLLQARAFQETMGGFVIWDGEAFEVEDHPKRLAQLLGGPEIVDGWDQLGKRGIRARQVGIGSQPWEIDTAWDQVWELQELERQAQEVAP